MHCTKEAAHKNSILVDFFVPIYPLPLLPLPLPHLPLLPLPLPLSPFETVHVSDKLIITFLDTLCFTWPRLKPMTQWWETRHLALSAVVAIHIDQQKFGSIYFSCVECTLILFR